MVLQPGTAVAPIVLHYPCRLDNDGSELSVLRKPLVLLLATAVLILLLGLRGSEPSATSYWLTRDAAPHVVGGIPWMVQNLAEKLQRDSGQGPATPESVLLYFDLVGRYNGECRSDWETPGAQDSRPDSACTSLRSDLDAQGPAVERLIQQQTSLALQEQGLGGGPWPPGGAFPPVLFTLRPPPTLLVVSPRNRIEMVGRVLLDPELTLSQAEALEAEVSRHNLSAMVTRIGGLGVYPSVVPESADLQWVLRTVAHEWAHQFFALRPLGWRYACGIEGDRRMVALNETAAEIIGREVGNLVYRQAYGGTPSEQPELTPSEIRFREQMRELRSQVDELLQQGRVEDAEHLMESRRQELNSEGFRLRVLNQAYFAFHGNYAEDPYLGGAEGQEISSRMHTLRENSGSLGAFAWAISSVGSYEGFLRLSD